METGYYSGATKKTDPTEIALVPKLNIRIMPILWAMVWYNRAISILFVGYLLMQVSVPSNMFLTKIRPSIYPLACMIGWATVSACTKLVQNHGGLVATRFMLGFVEAPYYPGALYIMSIFYTCKELATRIVWLTLVRFPSITRWRTQEERDLAVARIRRDTVGVKERGTAWEGFKQVCADPRTWLFCLMQNLHNSAVTFNNFFPTIIASLGFKSHTTAPVLTAPPYFVRDILGIPFAWSSGHFNERSWHITGGLGLAVVSFDTSVASMNTAIRYTATFLYATGAYSVGSVLLGWVNATLSQTQEKKAVAYSLVNVTAKRSRWTKIQHRLSSMIAFAAENIACVWIMRFWLIAQNRKMRRTEGDHQVAYAY
ncbi:MFS general substrate transporter [Macroventuria anomochaeta]|uniref:MFS general substrate transporter n=1 Tax=Macroventuria anomochaeta TaxID=301207 RepID=A0ACB6RIW0_9PLEO|nr:MFS general substrate transporter [Macroventuria anomochaeta]KAF2621673.1 MFS general substrate transporter [Macroventuria anomochaeta]